MSDATDNRFYREKEQPTSKTVLHVRRDETYGGWALQIELSEGRHMDVLYSPHPFEIRNADEPSVLGGGCGVPPMPTVTDAIEAHVRQIEQLCDAANIDPSQWLIGAEPPAGDQWPTELEATQRVASIMVGAAGKHAERVVELEAEVSTLRESLAEVNRLLSLHVAEVARLKAGEGPGEEDGPWADGWEQRAALTKSVTRSAATESSADGAVVRSSATDETTACKHIYVATAGSKIGDGFCVHCGAKEPESESDGRI